MDYARRPHSMDGFLDDVKGFLSDVQGVGTKFQAAQQAWQSPSPTATQNQNAAVLNTLFNQAYQKPAAAPQSTFFTPQVKKYLMWGGIGLAGLLVLTVVAKAVRK